MTRAGLPLCRGPGHESYFMNSISTGRNFQFERAIITVVGAWVGGRKLFLLYYASGTPSFFFLITEVSARPVTRALIFNLTDHHTFIFPFDKSAI